VDILGPVSRSIAELISKGCPQGWKTLGFKDKSHIFDSSIISAVFEHCSTLENFRIELNLEFNSARIQKLLCSSPRLKRLDICPRDFGRGQLPEDWLMMADDICEDWVCLGLESFRCLIGGIPRPDVQTAVYSGEPLESELHDPEKYSRQQSRQVQEKVLAQLGRLTSLKDLTLGVDPKVNYGRCGSSCCDGVRHLPDEEYCIIMGLPFDIAHNHQSLSMALQDGLDQLRELKSLRRLQVDKMSLRIEDKEREWMKANWPECDGLWQDPFWTSRGYPA